MRTINMKEARACLGSLVDGAERGETVVITRHGKKSARLVPMPACAKSLPSLSEFRSGMAKPRTGLGASVLAARREERF